MRRRRRTGAETGRSRQERGRRTATNNNGDGDNNGLSGDDAPVGAAPARAAGAGAGDDAAELERFIALANVEIQLAPATTDEEDSPHFNKHVAEKELALSQAPTQTPATQNK